MVAVPAAGRREVGGVLLNDHARRLLRGLPGGRAALAALALIAAATAVLVVVQADVLARILADGVIDGADAGELATGLLALGGVVSLRGVVGWGQQVVARRVAASAKRALRGELLASTQRLGPGWLGGRRGGELATLSDRGLDSLDPYFVGYLPQLLIAAIVPMAVVVRLFTADLASAVIICVTLPLIPVFGILVGLQTKAATRRQWRALERLGGRFLDLVAGLPTLRAFGRAKAQAAMVREAADGHRLATMRTLRVAFLSALVLELVATMSVALVAVPVGLRLLDGALDLHTALLVLLLAPEAYLPWRALGSQFHASTEGIEVAERVFAVTDEPAAATVVNRDRVTPGAIRLEGVRVRYAARETAVLHDLSLTVAAGERLAIVGPSGAGKTTLLGVVLGLVRPEAGTVDVGAPGVAWVPQRPHLFAGTVAENIRLGRPEASDDEVRRAAESAHAHEFVVDLPLGYETVLGERGHGLSAGQRQRLALARAFLMDAPIVVLDEPTAGLDLGSEARVVEASRRLMTDRTVLVVAHRPAMLHEVDRVIRLEGGTIVSDLQAPDTVLDSAPPSAPSVAGVTP